MVDKTWVAPEEQDQVYTPEMEAKIQKLLDFFGKIKNPYGGFDSEFLDGTGRGDIVGDKKAYPNNEQYSHIPGARDTAKWLQTVREVYYKERNGANRIAAIRQATNGWNPMETYDFLNWLKFYEGNTHLKYKTAQLWYENGSPGYFLHIKQDPQKEQTPSVQGQDIDMARDSIADELPASEKKRIIEKQRNKIVGRLDSAEKLLRTHEGQIFAGKEFESLLEIIYQLKKKIQMVNKISISTKLYEDMIIREANIMNKKGFVKAANLLFSISQANNPPPPGTGTNDVGAPITPVSPAPPTQNTGAPGGLPSIGPGMPQTPPESAPNESTPKGIDLFLKNLDPGEKDDEHASEDDILEVSDSLDVNDIEDEVLVTEAQEVPPPPASKMPAKPPVAPVVPPKPSKTLKPSTDNVAEVDAGSSPESRDFDRIIDSAFANVTVNDIISKLKDIAKVYKTREIPRQLSIIDMMLDSKGWAAYFPSLSEAINKALESNNYIATRLDDILSKLEGGIEGKDLDLRGDNKSTSPEDEAFRQKLEMQEQKDKTKKKMRAEQADRELAESMQPAKETPEVDIEEDLSKPPAPPEAPQPAKPTAAPAR
jgi:hypothetical protein